MDFSFVFPAYFVFFLISLLSPVKDFSFSLKRDACVHILLVFHFWHLKFSTICIYYIVDRKRGIREGWASTVTGFM